MISGGRRQLPVVEEDDEELDDVLDANVREDFEEDDVEVV